MKKVYEFINNLTVKELVQTYETEYLPFKNTGICPDGNIRKISRLAQEVIGDHNIGFAEKLFIERCAKVFFDQNK